MQSQRQRPASPTKAPPEGPAVTREQLEMAKSYVKHRYRSGINPVSTAAPGTEDRKLRELTESVLEKEYNLICTQIEHCQADVLDLKEDFETLIMGTERSNQLLTMYDMKLRESREQLDRLEAAMAKAGVSIPQSFNGLSTMDAVLAQSATMDVGGNRTIVEAQKLVLPESNDATQQQSATELSMHEKIKDSQHKLQVATQRSTLQKALVDAMRSCITTQFPHLLESASAQCTLRRREEFARQWCEETKSELAKLQSRQDALQAEKAERQRQLEEANRALEEAHRNVFTKRKHFIITHKRLLGRERLPSGQTLRPGVCQDIVSQIKHELQQGSTATLAALAKSDCKDLEKYAEGAGSGGAGSEMYRTPAHDRGYSSRAAAAAWLDTAQ